jgi:hypothetical protein
MWVVLFAVLPHPFLSPIQYSSFFSTLPLSGSDPSHKAKRWGKVMHSRRKTATARPVKGRQRRCWRPREERPRAAVSCGALPHLSCSADASDPILHYQGVAIPFLFLCYLYVAFQFFLSSAACIRGMPAAIAFICRQQQQSYEVCYYCFLNIPRIVVV